MTDDREKKIPKAFEDKIMERQKASGLTTS